MKKGGVICEDSCEGEGMPQTVQGSPQGLTCEHLARLLAVGRHRGHRRHVDSLHGRQRPDQHLTYLFDGDCMDIQMNK